MINNKLITISAGIFLGCSTLGFAGPTDPDYFIDHFRVAPGKTVTQNYAFPSKEHYIQCNQDSPAAELGSIEWKYHGTKFKGQIGLFPRLTLMREDISRPELAGGVAELADVSGVFVITNLSTTDLFVTCRYSLSLD